MNVFVLSTGRSGSKTFFKACSHIKNYSSGHERNWGRIGEDRLTYPENFIAIDNRLTWLLGKLDKRYGNSAFYVHLIRDRDEVAKSLNKRWKGYPSIIEAYRKNIIVTQYRTIDLCYDYYDTVNYNIELFLKDKDNKMNFYLDDCESNFEIFWKKIRAKGDLEKAKEEWSRTYNSSKGNSGITLAKLIYRVKNLFR